MKRWKWLVGKVTRLRRTIVRAFGRGGPGSRQTDEPVALADEPEPGPPEHWVERVRRGAPGLLEPSARRPEPAEHRGGDDGAPSQAELKTEPEPLDEAEPDHVPPARPRRSRLRRGTRDRVRNALGRPRSAGLEASRTVEDLPREVHVPAQRPDEARVAVREPTKRRGVVEPTAVAGEAERFPRQHEVVELEAPARRRADRSELPATLDRPRAAVVTRPEAPRAELRVEEARVERVWERPATPRPAETRSPIEPRREHSISRQEPPAEPATHSRDRPDPLAVAETHPWPELPAPLEQLDDGVEAALRAREHQQRIDLEQTRL